MNDSFFDFIKKTSESLKNTAQDVAAAKESLKKKPQLLQVAPVAVGKPSFFGGIDAKQALIYAGIGVAIIKIVLAVKK